MATELRETGTDGNDSRHGVHEGPSAVSRDRSAGSSTRKSIPTSTSGKKPRYFPRTSCSRRPATWDCWGSLTRRSTAGRGPTIGTTWPWPRNWRASTAGPSRWRWACKPTWPRRRSISIGSHELKKQFLEPAIRGDAVCSIAVTEPGAGSDVASIRTKAERDGDEYVINGSKMFITNGVQADWICLSGPHVAGHDVQGHVADHRAHRHAGFLGQQES